MTNPNSYKIARQLGYVGSSTEIVVQLQATGVTRRPILLSDLTKYLNMVDMLTKTDGSQGEERWIGSLQQMKLTLLALATPPENATPEELVTAEGYRVYYAAYRRWFSHITNPRTDSWDTTDPTFSAPFLIMEQAFADQEGMPTSEQFEAIVAMGGGRLWTDLTEAVYMADQAAAEAEAAAEAARQLKKQLEAIPDSRYQAFVTLHNSVKARIQSGELTTEAEVNAAMEAV